jgi:hypothetical protein
MSAAPTITRMGYEAQLFYGTPGSSATNQIENAVDIDYSVDPDRGPTTTRGDGLSVPIYSSRVTQLKPTVTWKMMNRPADTILASLLAAAATGAAVALRTKSYSSGKGFDGDVTLSVKEGAPLNGEGTFEFTSEPTEESGRRAQSWV